jgi:hypothetical protein
MASSSQIKPGETGSVTATVSLKNYNGRVTKEITVYSNDPQKPRVSLILTADVRSN